MSDKELKVETVKGAEKQLKEKDNTRKIVSVVSVVAFVLAATFLVLQLPGFLSQKAFDKAVLCEQEYDYDNAIVYYQKVKESDKVNFEVASSKLIDLKFYVEKNKYVASCVDCASIAGACDISSFAEAEDVKISPDQTSVSFVYDGVGYIVSSEKPNENRYYTVFEEKSYDLYVVKYQSSATMNGVLSSLAEEIRTETSNYMFKTATEEYTNDYVLLQLAARYSNLKPVADTSAQQ